MLCPLSLSIELMNLFKIPKQGNIEKVTTILHFFIRQSPDLCPITMSGNCWLCKKEGDLSCDKCTAVACTDNHLLAHSTVLQGQQTRCRPIR